MSNLKGAVQRSNVAVFDGDFVQAGTHINGVGSYLPEMREIPEELITAKNKIIADDLHGMTEETGEFITAAEKGQWSFEQLHGTLEQLELKIVTAEKMKRS